MKAIVIDYGLGNVQSVANMLRRTAATTAISADTQLIYEADLVVLPGFGAFDSGMKKLARAGLDEALRERAKMGKAVLGICLGMQLLFDCSEEGREKGLGLIPGDVRKLSVGDGSKSYPIPHMGWSEVVPSAESKLYHPGQNHRFYFVHSYHACCADESYVDATANYGVDFTCGVRKNLIFGVQFHPEKSHRFGLSFFNEVILQCKTFG